MLVIYGVPLLLLMVILLLVMELKLLHLMRLSAALP